MTANSSISLYNKEFVLRKKKTRLLVQSALLVTGALSFFSNYCTFEFDVVLILLVQVGASRARLLSRASRKLYIFKRGKCKYYSGAVKIVVSNRIYSILGTVIINNLGTQLLCAMYILPLCTCLRLCVCVCVVCVWCVCVWCVCGVCGCVCVVCVCVVFVCVCAAVTSLKCSATRHTTGYSRAWSLQTSDHVCSIYQSKFAYHKWRKHLDSRYIR